jgi:hypothetical protein
MSMPVSPDPVTQSGVRELPAYLSNGLIGLRVLDIPLLSGMVLVNGYAGIDPTMRIEAAARAPYPLGGDIAINGVRLRSSPHQARFIDQAYDFGAGELTTRFAYETADGTAFVTVLTFCSRSRPTLALQEISLEVERPVEVALQAIVDPRDIHGRMVERVVKVPGEQDALVDGAMAWSSLGEVSRCGLAYHTQLVGTEPDRVTKDEGRQSPLSTEYTFRARPGRPYRLRQVVSIVPSVLHERPESEAIRHVGWAAEIGFDELRAENRRAWEEIWRGRIVVTARDPLWQRLADAAFFYLNTSAHPSAPASTSIFGLATWEDYHYYYGHVMWDIETFVVPPLLMLQPAAARTLLQYRTQTLRAARGSAKLRGLEGIRFPWESGPRAGQEAAPGLGRASWHADHASLDIGWAFAQFAHATGDRRFLAEDAAPVLYGVADWVVSRVTRERDGYTWPAVMGIAERSRPSTDDAYTLMAATIVLREAIACAETLGHHVGDAWQEVAAGLRPRRGRSGAIMSHDGFHPTEEKGATPGPLAGLFPLWYGLDPDVAQKTLEYYLRLAPGYIGSPMLSAFYGVWAAWAGDRQLSARLFDEGYARFVRGRFLQTREYLPERFPDEPEAGPFFANIGAFLIGLLQGLPGIRVGPGDPSSWPCRPVVLPAEWQTIEVERLWIRGRPASIVARHGDERAVVDIAPRSTRRRGAGSLRGRTGRATGAGGSRSAPRG